MSHHAQAMLAVSWRWLIWMLKLGDCGGWMTL